MKVFVTEQKQNFCEMETDDRELTSVSPLPQLPPEMFERIFSFLDFEDLTNCRLVNNLCRFNAKSKVTNFFIKLHQYRYPRDILTIKEKFGFSPTKTLRLTLEDIKTKLKASPLKKIWIDIRETDVTTPEVNELFLNFGHFVKYFSCKSACYGFGSRNLTTISATTLLNLVKGHLKNLEYLTLNPGLVSDWEEGFRQSVGPPYSKLKTLRFVRSIYSVEGPRPVPWQLLHQKMIQSGDFASLESVHGVPDPYVYKSELMGRGHLVKSISYQSVVELAPKTLYRFLHGTERTLCHLARFSIQNSLKLEQLELCVSVSLQDTFFEISELYGSIFGQILSKTSETLKKLTIQPLSSFGPFQFPRLEKLTTLCLTDLRPCMEGSGHDQINSGSLFPFGFDVRGKFPNVSHLEISIHISDPPLDDPMTKFEQFFPVHTFPPTCDSDPGVLPKVRHLKLTKYQPGVCLQRLLNILPNVTFLTIDLGLDSLFHILPSCFTSFGSLKELTLVTDISDQESNLDGVITGLSQSTLYDLTHSETKEKISVVEQWREGPGITEMKNLELLKFVLKPEIGFSIFSRSQTLISKLSHLYGFRLLHGLAVLVEFHESSNRSQNEEMRKKLAPFEDFLTIHG